MIAADPLLIAGGGIAGLSTALALAKIGRKSRVLERNPTFSEAGAGIQLGPNGVRALVSLGAAQFLDPQVGIPSAIVVRDGASARILQTLPLGQWIAARHGAPYWVVHRRDLQSALLAACRERPEITIVPGFEAAAVSVSGTGVQVSDGGGRLETGSALVGADGVFSRVRRYVAPNFEPAFSGRTAARTILSRDRADARDIDLDATGVWLAPGSHVVHYPVRAGREIAVVVIRTEDWRDATWSAPVEAAWLETALAGFAPSLRRLLETGSDWRKWALFQTDPPSTWCKGPVTLAGDAAHPVLPFLAQGGCLALEDALTLAAAMAAEPAAERAFRRYQAARLPRATRVARASRRNGEIFHLSGWLASARNLAMASVPAERLMAGYDWLYGWRPPAPNVTE